MDMRYVRDKAQEIVRIVPDNEVLEAIMTLVSVKPRAREYTDLYQLKRQLRDEGFTIDDDKYIAAFEEMDKIGIGQVRREKGKPTRFRWHLNMRALGQAALSMMTPRPKPEIPRPMPVKAQGTYLIISLDDQREVRVDMPLDISKEEMHYLAQALENRP